MAKSAIKPASSLKTVEKTPAKIVSKPAAKVAAKPAKAAEKPVAKTVAKQVSKIAANIAAKAAAKEAIRAKNGLPTNAVTKNSVTKNGTSKPAAKVELSENEMAALTMIRTFSPPVQPAQPAEPVSAKATHKYQVGDAVYFTSPSFGRAAASGTYTVIKVLPSDGEDRQYRIKSSVEAFERVAKESQLERM